MPCIGWTRAAMAWPHLGTDHEKPTFQSLPPQGDRNFLSAPTCQFEPRLMRILLAEEDKILADALGRALTRSAYAVDVTHTGSQAEQALFHGRPGAGFGSGRR
jgi:hypothetical protein